MSSMKGKLARLLGGMLLKNATVASTEDVGQGFRKLLLRGDIQTPRAGTKLQMLLPSDDMRTYTPIATANGVALLGWKHAGGPGARWISEAKVGDEVRFVGPQRSLELAAGPIILVGDETSVAVASALHSERSGEVQVVLQAGSVEDVQIAADAMGLHDARVVARADAGALVEAAIAAQNASPQAVFALTGGAETVTALRAALRTRGISNIKTKPYWVPGVAGLD